jgi:hypothetical protein
MIGAYWIASIRQASGQLRGESEAPLHVVQHKNATVRRQQPAIKRNAHLLAANRWQRKRQDVIFAHGGFAAP